MTLAHRWRAAALVLGMIAAGVVPSVASAQTTAAEPVQVTLELASTDPNGPSGFAILTAGDAGTAVNVLASRAPKGTTATIHAGSCLQVETVPVGLIGELGTGGQALAVVPQVLPQLTDGRHVLVLHPGLDFSTNLACGLIPLIDAGLAIPQLPIAPLPTTAAPPVVISDAECDGIPAWLAATQARYDRITAIEDAANKAAGGFDTQAYLSAVTTGIGQIGVMLREMRAETVPAAAAEIQQQLMQALQLGMEGGTLLLDAFARGDPDIYQRAVGKARESSQLLLQTKTSTSVLQSKCPAAPTA